MSAIKDQELACAMGEILQQFMKKHDLSDSMVAGSVGSSTSAVRTWRNGRVPNPPYRTGLSRLTGWDWHQPLDLLVQEMRRFPNGHAIISGDGVRKLAHSSPNPIVGRVAVVAARHGGPADLLKVYASSVDAFLTAPYQGGGDLDQAVKVILTFKNHKSALSELKTGGVLRLSSEEVAALDEVFGS